MVRQANYWYHLEDFAVGDEVIINIWNFVSDWSTRALNDKKHKSFRILQQFHFFYKLDVFSEWYATDIFHVSNLIRVTDPKQLPFTEQRNPLLKLAVINNKNQAEWVLEEILNLQYSGSNCHLQYKVHWFDCDSDSTWYNADSDEFQNALKALYEYHAQYFNKSDLQLIESKLICHQLTKADQKEIQNTVSEIISGSLLLLYWV